ncbi:MAG: hypothetical protein HKN82_13080 [Akkermansiaceae bacterium]|nr:hypothetical protein [Akkermansiaceae bacterium]
MILIRPWAIAAGAACLFSSSAHASFRVNDLAIDESAGSAMVEIILTAPLGNPSQVDWETLPGTAQAGLDYTTSSGTAMFPMGTTSVMVPVPLTNDGDPECDEVFQVRIFNPTETSVSDSLADVTILENDIVTLQFDPGDGPLGSDAGAADVAPRDGMVDGGLFVYNHPNTNGGSFCFKVVLPATTFNLWRTVLNVTAGDASLHMSRSAIPDGSNGTHNAATAGSEGILLRDGEFNAAETWYLRVDADPGTTWSLFTGEPYVEDLGTIVSDTDGGYTDTHVTIGPEGIAFFETMVPAGTLAWALWLNGDSRLVAVDKGSLPIPDVSGRYDRRQAGQMLLVPPYLGSGSATYFFSVKGTEGEVITIDSHQVIPQALGYDAGTGVVTESASGAPYRVFEVPVPISSLAWDVQLFDVTAGNPDVAVRQGDVPSEFTNLAFSEAAGTALDSVTMVPPTLTDGTWYITVYSEAAFSLRLRNGDPEFTGAVVDIDFLDTQDTPEGPEPNPLPGRAGWVYFKAGDTGQQSGVLGWELTLLNQVAGTEIAVRQNAVPGRMTFRNVTTQSNVTLDRGPVAESTTTHVDDSSLLGFLQRPSQQADVWYVGINLPGAALGAFDLSRTEIMPPIRSANGISEAVAGHLPKTWQFFRFDIDDGILGWETRLEGVTGGEPRMIVRRALLPNMLTGSTRSGSTDWPNGEEVRHADDWFTRPAEEDYRWALSATGKPLELAGGSAVTYYVGVFNDSDAASSDYTFVSRVIDDDHAPYPADRLVNDLDFTGAGATVNRAGLPAGEADFYKLTIPAGVRSWRVRVTPTGGDARFFVRKDFVPTYDARINDNAHISAGVEMERAGHEVFHLLPLGNTEFLEECDYFIAVVAEQAGPADYTLVSEGEIPFEPTITPTAAGTVVPYAIPADELELHRIDVPPGTLALEVRLDESAGAVDLALRDDLLISRPNMPNSPSQGLQYGVDGTNTWTFSDDRIITVPNPVPGTYTLILRANRSSATVPQAASGNLVVTSRLETTLAPDGGSLAVSNQEPESWRYFEVTIPASGLLGWDLKIDGISGGGDPRLVVCRDLAPPNGVVTIGFSPSASRSRTWPSGASWTQIDDWTNRSNNDGTSNNWKRFTCAFGAPLEAGTYIVGIYNADLADDASYTITSRLVGDVGSGASIELGNLAFAGGSDAITALDPREAAYYRVTIPPNTPNWKIQLANATSDDEACLVVRWEFIPDCEGDSVTGTTPFDERGSAGGGALIQKNGNEYYHLLPEDGQPFLQAGDYFIAAVSEGQSPPAANRIGAGAVDATLTSCGEIPFTAVDPVQQPVPGVPLLLDPLLPAKNSLSFHDAEVKRFTFEVPAGASSLEISLRNRVGDEMAFSAIPGALMPEPYTTSPAYSQQYGIDEGTGSADFYSASIRTIAEPAAGVWTLLVRPYAANASSWDPVTTVDLCVQVVAPIPLAFCGGSFDFTGSQLPQSWRYFKVDVPAMDPMGDPYLGWDIGVSDYTGGNPRIYIRRDDLPLASGAPSVNRYSLTWPSGRQMPLASTDWTGLTLDVDGTNRNQDRDLLVMGRPLEPGTYFVGVFNASNSEAMNYTIESRCLGEPGSGADFEVTDLPFTGGVAGISNLGPRRGAFFRVAVPPNVENWRLRLDPTAGNAMMAVRKELPAAFRASENLDADTANNDGVSMRRAGSEIYTLLPANNQAFVADDIYYVAVVGLGLDGTSTRVGTGNVNATLTSVGELAIPDLGTVGSGGMLTEPVALEAGEVQVKRFEVAAGIDVLEMRLDNRVENPRFSVRVDTNTPAPNINNGTDRYGYDHGWLASAGDDQIVTFVDPAPGTYTVTLRASKVGSAHLNASADLVIEDVGLAPLAFSAEVGVNTDTGLLIDGQERYYAVMVPDYISRLGQIVPVLGWKLTLTESSGSATMRVMDTLSATGGFAENDAYAIVVPPFLKPGNTYYVEVKGTGLTNYTITSEAIDFAAQWTMPADYNIEFGDSGESDLGEDDWHFYAVDVPKDNGGVLRTELVALNGNPNLYIREDGIPTRSHQTSGGSGSIVSRTLNGSGSEYANWVPLDGKTEEELRPGRWVLGVQAAGSNSRYRLKASTGTVRTLPLGGGSAVDVNVLGDDFSYFKVTIPDDAPAVWTLSFTEDFGNVSMHLRDSIPPGNGASRSTSQYKDADDDNKNNWTLTTNTGFDSPGAHDIPTPPLRPGHTYFVGIRGVLDGTFDLDSAVSPALFTAPDGTVPGVPTYGALTDVDFFGASGSQVFNLVAGAHRTFRVSVPDGGTRWVHTTTRSANVQVRIDQGAPAPFSGSVPYNSTGANSSLSRALASSAWPWQPGQVYYVTFINNGGGTEGVTFTMNGEGDISGYLGWAASFGLTGPDADPGAVNNAQGIRNIVAYALGIHPLNGVSPGAVIDPRPRIVLSDGAPQFPGIEFYVPTTAPDDICIVAEEVFTLTDPWNELGIRAGQGGWTGTGFIVEQPPASGYHRVIVFSTNQVADFDRNFLRLRVFLRHP